MAYLVPGLSGASPGTRLSCSLVGRRPQDPPPPSLPTHTSLLDQNKHNVTHMATHPCHVTSGTPPPTTTTKHAPICSQLGSHGGRFYYPRNVLCKYSVVGVNGDTRRYVFETRARASCEGHSLDSNVIIQTVMKRGVLVFFLGAFLENLSDQCRGQRSRFLEEAERSPSCTLSSCIYLFFARLSTSLSSNDVFRRRPCLRPPCADPNSS